MKLLLFILSFAFIGQPAAQETADYPYKRFGFVAGINVANMNFNKGVPAPSVAVDASWKGSITMGFLAHIPLSEKFSLQPEYSYTQRRGADKSIATNYTTGYFSLPLLLNYNISPRVSIVAGPQAELLVYANADSNGVKRSITHDVEERSIGLTAGLEVQLFKSFFISAHYLHGLNHIGIGQRSDIKEFKYEVVTVLLGIGF